MRESEYFADLRYNALSAPTRRFNSCKLGRYQLSVKRAITRLYSDSERCFQAIVGDLTNYQNNRPIDILNFVPYSIVNFD